MQIRIRDGIRSDAEPIAAAHIASGRAAYTHIFTDGDCWASARPLTGQTGQCMSDVDYLRRILNARVYDVAIETPLDHAPALSRRLGNNVLLKRDDLDFEQRRLERPVGKIQSQDVWSAK